MAAPRKAALDSGKGRNCLVLGPLGTYGRYRARNAGGDAEELWEFRYIRAIATRVKGVDINEPLVQLARSDGFDIEWGDVEALELHERFDIIFASHIIEHLGKPIALFEGAARHLQPDGLLIIETPNPFSFEWMVKGLLCSDMNCEPTHTCWIDLRQARELGRRTGFSIEKAVFYTPIDWRGLRYIASSSIYRAVSQCVPRLGSNLILYYRPGGPVERF